MDKISYALGLGIGQQLKSMNIKGFNLSEFSRSIGQIMDGQPTDMTAREAQEMLEAAEARCLEMEAAYIGKRARLDEDIAAFAEPTS